jgi:hypothetical protein
VRSAMAMMAPLAWLSYDGPDAAVFFWAGWGERGGGVEGCGGQMGYVGMCVDFENAACAGSPPVQSASPAPARSGSLYVEREQTCEAAPRS